LLVEPRFERGLGRLNGGLFAVFGGLGLDPRGFLTRLIHNLRSFRPHIPQVRLAHVVEMKRFQRRFCG
jgi:hypothetical protein